MPLRPCSWILELQILKEPISKFMSLFKNDDFTHFCTLKGKYNLYLVDYIHSQNFNADNLLFLPDIQAARIKVALNSYYFIADPAQQRSNSDIDRLFEGIQFSRKSFFMGSDSVIKRLQKKLSHPHFFLKEYSLMEVNFLQDRTTKNPLPFPIVRIQKKDIDKLAPLSKLYLEEETYPGRTVSHSFVQKHILRQIENYSVWSMMDNKKCVAQIAINASSPHFRQIGSVYTLAEYRGRGLASMLVDFVIEDGKKQGQKTILFVNKSNRNAIALYKKLRFKEIDLLTSLETQ